MSQIQDISDHDCDVCGDTIPWTEGHSTCEEHFYCTGCLTEVFERSVQNMNEFPVSCCGNTRNGIQLSAVDSLFSDDFLVHYKSKLEEHQVLPENRVYCANVGCAKFQRIQAFHDHTVKCECGTTTCTRCKTEHNDGHSCSTRGSAGIPPYSPTCRIKQCPECQQWIELKDACNHIACGVCKHHFCFVCLLPWRRAHQGCPYYNDPPEGYDEQGFERNNRGLHVRTGLNQQGYNRLGRHYMKSDHEFSATPILFSMNIGGQVKVYELVLVEDSDLHMPPDAEQADVEHADAEQANAGDVQPSMHPAMGIILVHLREQLEARGVELDEGSEQAIVRLLKLPDQVPQEAVEVQHIEVIISPNP